MTRRVVCHFKQRHEYILQHLLKVLELLVYLVNVTEKHKTYESGTAGRRRENSMSHADSVALPMGYCRLKNYCD